MRNAAVIIFDKPVPLLSVSLLHTLDFLSAFVQQCTVLFSPNK